MEFIGKGSGRKVYDLGNNTVLKKAINSGQRGYAQNRREYEISTDYNSKYLASVISIECDDSELIMQKVTPITKITGSNEVSAFKRNLNYLRSYFMAYKHQRTPIQNMHRVFTSKRARTEIDMVIGSELCDFINDLVKVYDLVPTDILRNAAWGYVEEEGFKLFDYGLYYDLYLNEYIRDQRSQKMFMHYALN